MVDNSRTPEQLINEVLLGTGIEAENITFNGSDLNTISAQFGTFNGEYSNIGLSHGIILATGGISVAQSPNDLPTAYVAIPEADELAEEPDLAQILNPVEIHDVAVIEFDFIPHGDRLTFSYVFASEEYNEYTCSVYNDAFGFFVSGPGIPANPNFQNNAQNVACVPGTNVPVAINTVNQGFAGPNGANSVCNAESSSWQANSIYFVNNESNTDINATQFDGFTKPMTVIIPVICGETYHIKIAIADATDRKNDSAVFIKAGSFETNAPLEARLEIIQPDTLGNGIEGCSSYRLRLARTDSIGRKTIYLRTDGLINADSIFPNFPDSVTFYSHDGVKIIDLETADNAIFEGVRPFSIQILQPEICSLDTSILNLPTSITDFPELSINYSDSIGLDCIESALVNIDVNGGYAPYTVHWDQPNAQGFNFTTSPDSLAYFSGTITDRCAIHSKNIDVIVYREAYADMTINLPDSVSFNCVDPVLLAPQVSGGYGEYDYAWSQSGVVLSNTLTLNQTITDTTALVFRVTDRCMPAVEKMVFPVSQTNPLVVKLGSDTTGTCSVPMILVPEVVGGFGQIDFLWKINNLPFSTQSIFNSLLSTTSAVTLTAIDECGQASTAQIVVNVPYDPILVDLPVDTAVCVDERLILDPSVTGGFGAFEYKWNGVDNSDGIYSVIPTRDITYSFSVTDECGVELAQKVKVRVEKVWADFEFDFEQNPVRLVNHSTLNCVYNWSFRGNASSQAYSPLVENEVLLNSRIFLVVRNSIGCEAEVSHFCKPPVRIFIPTAFTPDGDGLNDIFKAEATYIAAFEIAIFDRWGALVFQSDNIDEGWDGSLKNGEYASENTVFTYRYTATDLEGFTHESFGVVHLIR